MTKTVDIVFDGPPSHEAPRFVEVERDGKSIKYGEWVHREDGYWVLRIPDSEAMQELVDAAIRWKVETVADDDDMERYEAEETLIAAVSEFLRQRGEKPTHYILVNEAGVYVKDAEFFRSQGGLERPWGKNWEPITADSLYHAREIGIKRRRERFPHSHKTLGEGEERHEDYWPEARGQ